jgi:N4-gp56 family major capsid protein
MATTSYGVNNALAVKLWAKKLFVESLKATQFANFLGNDSSSLVQWKDETSKSAGDRITVGLRMQLTGGGVQGDGTLEGNEEALVTYTDNLFIDQLRHAVRSAGKMSEQRIPFSVRDEAMSGLRDWWADRLDQSFFNQICGNNAQTDTRYTGNQATIIPNAANYISAKAAATADESITSSDTMTLTVIDKAVAAAKTLTPMIRPVKVEGQDKYVCFLHPYQVYSIRTATTTGQWLDIQKAAMAGADSTKSPIYTGAIGEYNGVVLVESARVSTGVNSSTAAAISTVRRAVLCGAQSAVFGTGREGGTPDKMNWVEELFDYENQLGVSAGLIFGLKKTVFNSKDFATIALPSYAVQPT